MIRCRRIANPNEKTLSSRAKREDLAFSRLARNVSGKKKLCHPERSERPRVSRLAPNVSGKKENSVIPSEARGPRVFPIGPKCIGEEKNSVILSEASAISSRRIWRAETMQPRVEWTCGSDDITTTLNKEENSVIPSEARGPRVFPIGPECIGEEKNSVILSEGSAVVLVCELWRNVESALLYQGTSSLVP
jgi:hypothetical protein